MNEEFISALNEIASEKGISKDIIFEALESALVSSYKKNYGNSQNVIVKMDRETGEIKLFFYKDIVEEVENDSFQISLEDAKKIDPNFNLGDIYSVEIHPKNFGRIAAQTAKQVVIQRIKDAERDVIFEDYTKKEREIITGLVQRTAYGNAYVDLGKVEGVLPPNEQIRGESYKHGDRYKMLLLEIKRSTKGPQIILSRSHPDLIKRLFELEVPEINDGLVEIYSISREAGSRTKIAVFSKDEEVDPLGACVGYKGQRVNAIVDEISNEKIDIVIYEKDPKVFIGNSLSPSKVEKVFIKDGEKSALAIVPDYQLSLAIGKEGQNVRLAAKLTGWKIDIKSVSQFEEFLEAENLTEEEFERDFSGEENGESSRENPILDSSEDLNELAEDGLTDEDSFESENENTKEVIGLDEDKEDFSDLEIEVPESTKEINLEDE
ncbi:transcription termination factor NusA [Peptoniphilus raoultii]|uniref:transcription termination factor NusA n=1 Tax=Peptoniphilus raoultii TaxID=1776387 RepID=UPI0008DA6EF3|nr:transcription termination factor NusA [Peptoniphilus raoultii]